MGRLTPVQNNKERSGVPDPPQGSASVQIDSQSFDQMCPRPESCLQAASEAKKKAAQVQRTWIKRIVLVYRPTILPGGLRQVFAEAGMPLYPGMPLYRGLRRIRNTQNQISVANLSVLLRHF